MIRLIHPTEQQYQRISHIVSYYQSLREEGAYYEFKVNFAEPKKIGEYLSVLSNEARLAGKEAGYLIWGIQDKTYELVGTTFDPAKEKVGNVELETWLAQLVEPKIDFAFYELTIEGKRVVVLTVEAAKYEPTRFEGREAIRNGSANKPLRDFPSKEARLWASFHLAHFERENAKSDLSAEEVFRLLDADSFYRQAKLPLPGMGDILSDFCRKGMLKESEGRYAITNAGALLLAKDLSDFPSVETKGIRVTDYETDSMTSAKGERIFSKGYLLAFDDCEQYVLGLLPRKEIYPGGRREEATLLPARAIREAIGNIIAHQDLTAPGFGPTIGIHPHYLSFANPGSFDGDIRRAMDMLPAPRNEVIMTMLHLSRICESRGMGIDLMEEWMGIYKEPSPLLYSSNGSTTILLRHYDSLTSWTSADLVNTVYSLTCFNHIAMKETGNAEVRERFGIKESNAAEASRLLKTALEAGLIKIANPEAGVKSRRYVPYWA